MARPLNTALGLSLYLGLACRSLSAQTLPPRLEVQRLTKEKLPSLPADRIGVGNCFASVSSKEMKEIATIGVSVYGPWERSAEHLAKQEAAHVGANCLQPLSSYGPEEPNYPIIRQYKAFIVTTVVTTPRGNFRLPAPASTFELPAQVPLPTAFSASAAATSPATSTTSVGEHEPVLAAATTRTHSSWVEGSPIDSHEVALDTSRMTAQDWGAVRRDFKKYFPPREYKELLMAHSNGESVSIDFLSGRIKRLGDDNDVPAAAGRSLPVLPLPRETAGEPPEGL